MYADNASTCELVVLFRRSHIAFQILQISSLNSSDADQRKSYQQCNCNLGAHQAH